MTHDKIFAVDFCYTTSVEIVFDDLFTLRKSTLRLGDAVSLADTMMKLHDFTSADIIDADTGEVIATVTAEEL